VTARKYVVAIEKIIQKISFFGLGAGPKAANGAIAAWN
jgi:hypothetical protein